MSKIKLGDVCDILGSAGIDYGLNDYSDFMSIDDKEFHRLLAKYRNAREKLLDYVDYDEFDQS